MSVEGFMANRNWIAGWKAPDGIASRRSAATGGDEPGRAAASRALPVRSDPV